MTAANLTITDCTIIAPASGHAAMGSLSVSGGVIVAPGSLSGDQPRLDGTDLYAIPGLIDMHVHATSDPSGRTAASQAKMSATTMTLCAVDNLATALRGGITSVRDLGAPKDLGFAIRTAWAGGLFVGARPFVAGPVITAVGGHGNWNGVESDGPSFIGGLVRHNVAKGADVVKLMMRSAARRMELRPEEVAEAVAEAHWLDVPVAVHANFSSRSIDVAVQAGCDTLEHGFAISAATARLMAEKGTALCPTTAALHSIVSDPGTWTRRSGRELVDRALQQFPEARASFERAVGAGVTLIAGTDAGMTGVSFAALAGELRTMVDWGASPGQALAAATSAAARSLRHPELGTLEAGTPADIVLLRADPLSDITACGQVEAVIQAGHLVRLDSPTRLTGGTPSSPPGTVLPTDRACGRVS